MAATITTVSVTDTTGMWWRIEANGDHYAVIVGSALIGTVERCYKNKQWGWYPIQGGSRIEHISLREALQEAKREAENLASPS